MKEDVFYQKQFFRSVMPKPWFWLLMILNCVLIAGCNWDPIIWHAYWFWGSSAALQVTNMILEETFSRKTKPVRVFTLIRWKANSCGEIRPRIWRLNLKSYAKNWVPRKTTRKGTVIPRIVRLWIRTFREFFGGDCSSFFQQILFG